MFFHCQIDRTNQIPALTSFYALKLNKMIDHELDEQPEQQRAFYVTSIVLMR